MNWKDIPFNTYVLFLEDWKSREDLQKEFTMSPIESWHCCKYLARCSGIMVSKGEGKTKRKILFRARSYQLELSKKEVAEKKFSKEGTTIVTDIVKEGLV